jgi:hypothetical protein
MLSKKVDKGAAFLDSHIPNWYNNVGDLESLDINSGMCCVLGKLGISRYGITHRCSPYMLIIHDLHLTIDEQIDYGFYSFHNEDFSVLTELWKDAILDRREQEAWAKQCRRTLAVELEEVLV